MLAIVALLRRELRHFWGSPVDAAMQAAKIMFNVPARPVPGRIELQDGKELRFFGPIKLMTLILHKGSALVGRSQQPERLSDETPEDRDFPGGATATVAECGMLVDDTDVMPDSPLPLGRLRDLPLPKDVEVAFDELCRARRLNETDQLLAAEELKLRYLYGGLLVVCEETREGRTIVAAGEGDEPDFQRALEIMHEEYPRSQRYQAFNVPELEC